MSRLPFKIPVTVECIGVYLAECHKEAPGHLRLTETGSDVERLIIQSTADIEMPEGWEMGYSASADYRPYCPACVAYNRGRYGKVWTP